MKTQDVEAAQRRQEFQIGWFADPVTTGSYPDSMRRLVGDRLPHFTADESLLLKNSCDYFALNHYTSRYAMEPLDGCPRGTGWVEDQCCEETNVSSDGKPIGPTAGSDWLLSVPWGMRKLLVWVSDRYRGQDIYITENGVDDPHTKSPLDDSFRIEYHQGYLSNVRDAIEEDGVPVKAYFVWSLLDNFEWGDGYGSTFGLWQAEPPYFERVPKASVAWFKETIANWTSSQ